MAGSAEKRPRDGAGSPPAEGRRSKRRRWDSDAPPADPPPAPPAPPAAAVGAPTAAAGHKLPETSALAKAKAVLAKQKALAEKLKKLERPETASETTPAALGGGPSTTTQSDAVRRALEVAKRARAARDAARAGTERRAASALATATAAPAPRALLLNDAGEEVDERGDVLETAGGGGVKAVSAFKVNAKSSEERRKVDKLEAFAALQRETAAEAAAADAAWMDPSVIGRRRGRKPEFKFVEEGTFQKQADMTRLRAKYGVAEARAILSREAAETAAGDANAVPLGEGARSAGGAATRRARAAGASFLPSLPEAGAAEWWDAALLSDGASYGAGVLREKITLYVEHPVPLAPPAGAEAPAPAPQPLKLTKAEQKKLRTQRRVAREQEKQEMIRQGLLEPPKPKVKISNLMRVLTDTAAADPTAIEKEVRAQMAERAEAHEDRNLARALTPAERKEKKLRKMFEDGCGAGETHVRVYRIESLENPKHKFRVDINAQENRLTGVCAVIEAEFCVVVVEGVSKAIRRYEKLMTRRIDWASSGAEADDAVGGASAEAAKPNACACVWSGTTASPAFEGAFRFETFRSRESARARFEQAGLAHFFDAAAGAVAAVDEAAEAED